MNRQWTVTFYELESGRSPVQDFIRQLQPPERVRVLRKLEMLQLAGLELSMPHVLPLQGSEIWELRVTGRVQHRVFYVAIQERSFLLLHAFTKKTQRTPRREIDIAEDRLREFRERHNENPR